MQKEGENVAINCSVGPGELYLTSQLVNDTDITLGGKKISSERTETGTVVINEPLTQSDNGVSFVCEPLGAYR